MSVPTHPARQRATMDDGERVAKICGADIELGNFLRTAQTHDGLQPGTAAAASRLMLREIALRAGDNADASAAGSTGGRRVFHPQDWGRVFLSSNASCAYIDLDHLELCIPEVTSAFDHVAAWHAMLRIAQHALARANARIPGTMIEVLVNNSDGLGHSYGSHLNFLISRAAFDNVFDRRLHYLLYLASYQASSVVITGQGKVGAENGLPAVAYQLSQRADFFETLVGEHTTRRRPLVNSRDEPLCGDPAPATNPRLARLHTIFFDSSLSHGSSLLKVGCMQLILSLLEARQVNPHLILDDPLDALRRWSRDPSLRCRARTLGGSEVTAAELQLLFAEEAERLLARGGYDTLVPRAGEILSFWTDTLHKLRERDLPGLVGRLDWVLKLHILRSAMRKRPQLTWEAPELKHLDHMYSHLAPDRGLYFVHEGLGVVERLVTDADIERFVHAPPEDTRAWTRAMLMRAAGAARVWHVDWDQVTVRQTGRGWPTLRTVSLSDPRRFTRRESAAAFTGAASLEEILDALHASPPDIDATPRLSEWRAPLAGH